MDTRKSVFRKVEKAIEAIERSSDVSSTIAEAASAFSEYFVEELPAEEVVEELPPDEDEEKKN
jgi:hypothetical protein